MKINLKSAKYTIRYTSKFSKNLKKIKKQAKDVEKLINVLEMLANGTELDSKYQNHKLITDKKYKNCYECHIEPDWLLIYRIKKDELVILALATGSHSELFDM